MTSAPWTIEKPTAVLVLADGTVVEGKGAGAVGVRQAEVCFNTAITGYQEILTDPSYAGQIVTFTFPHVGNVGVNEEDIETLNLAAEARVAGAVFRAEITNPSNWRSTRHFDEWLKARSEKRRLETMAARSSSRRSITSAGPGTPSGRAEPTNRFFTGTMMSGCSSSSTAMAVLSDLSSRSTM